MKNNVFNILNQRRKKIFHIFLHQKIYYFLMFLLQKEKKRRGATSENIDKDIHRARKMK